MHEVSFESDTSIPNSGQQLAYMKSAYITVGEIRQWGMLICKSIFRKMKDNVRLFRRVFATDSVGASSKTCTRSFLVRVLEK